MLKRHIHSKSSADLTKLTKHCAKICTKRPVSLRQGGDHMDSITHAVSQAHALHDSCQSLQVVSVSAMIQ